MDNSVTPAPPPPTRPKTAYLFFVTERLPLRPSDVVPKQYFKILSEQWKVIPDEGKMKYDNLAVMAKENYTIALNEYRKKYTDEEMKLYRDTKRRNKRGDSAVSKKKDPNRKKKSYNGYNVFIKDYSKRMRDLKASSSANGSTDGANAADGSSSGKNLIKAASVEWNLMSKEEQQSYVTKANMMRMSEDGAAAAAGAAGPTNGKTANVASATSSMIGSRVATANAATSAAAAAAAAARQRATEEYAHQHREMSADEEEIQMEEADGVAYEDEEDEEDDEDYA